VRIAVYKLWVDILVVHENLAVWIRRSHFWFHVAYLFHKAYFKLRRWELHKDVWEAVSDIPRGGIGGKSSNNGGGARGIWG
jgi:hypothetical protein